MNSERQLQSTFSISQMKMLKHFGEDITFGHAKERSNSRLVLSRNASVTQAVNNSEHHATEKKGQSNWQFELKNCMLLNDNYCDKHALENECVILLQ